MSDIKKEKTKKTLKLIAIFFKFLILLIFLIGIPFYVFYFHRELIQTFDSLDSISAFLLKYESASIFAYIGFQIIQIIIFVIPGQAIQLAGGYLFSFWLGFIITFIGVALGTVITFYLARILGKDAIHLIIGEERTHHYIEKFNSKKVFMIIFIIFLIPGIPKDAVTYIAGISDMNARPFIIISLLGRLPSMIGSVMIGSMLKNGSYTGVVIISIVAVICFVLGIIFKDKLIGKSDKFYHKVTEL